MQMQAGSVGVTLSEPSIVVAVGYLSKEPALMRAASGLIQPRNGDSIAEHANYLMVFPLIRIELIKTRAGTVMVIGSGQKQSQLMCASFGRFSVPVLMCIG